MKASTRHVLLIAVLAFLFVVIVITNPSILINPNNTVEQSSIISFQVTGLSMEPEFIHNEVIEVDKNSYIQSSPKLGDVIAFQFENSKDPIIKRVIATTGDIVKIEDGWLWINQEKKIPSGRFNNKIWIEGESYTIKQDKYFVLSDNSSIGEDSRIWGLVSKKDVIGKVLTR
jgi:signal peptidase I